VKTSTVAPSFYFVFNISLFCEDSMPNFIANLWRVLLLGNYLKLLKKTKIFAGNSNTTGTDETSLCCRDGCAVSLACGGYFEQACTSFCFYHSLYCKFDLQI